MDVVPPKEDPVKFPAEVADVCQAWIEYKRQADKKYKPMGLKKLVTQVENAVRSHGSQAVREAMEQAMANNYQGWTFCVGKSGGNGSSGGKTWGQQRQQNMVDLLAKLKAEDEAGGQARIGQEAGK